MIPKRQHGKCGRTRVGPPLTVCDHVVQLQVHLRRRLLHVLDVRGGVVEQTLALAQVVPKRRDLGVRVEAGAQQPILVQPLQPLGVAHVGLAAWHVLGVAGVDQHDHEAALLQHLVGRDPVNPGALHRHGPHAAALEPIGHAVQVGGEGAEAAHRLGVAIRPDGGHVQRGADVDRGRMGVDGRHRPLPAGPFGFAHRTLLCCARAEGMGCATDQFPNRDRPQGTPPLASAQQPTGQVGKRGSGPPKTERPRPSGADYTPDRFSRHRRRAEPRSLERFRPMK